MRFCKTLGGALFLVGLGTLTTFAKEENAIDEARFVAIGGIEHWLTIKGANRENPVLFIVHGGPGNPLSQFSDALYPGWEEEFTLVHYDQRGAGRTYGRNMPVEELSKEILEKHPLTLDLLVQDGNAIAAYVADYLHKEQLILTGSSWGAALAAEIYQARPDLYRALVVLSPMVSFRENLEASYRRAMEEATARGDASALAILEEIGPPPWSNPRSIGKLRRIVRQFEADSTTMLLRLESRVGENPEAYWAAYAAGEEFSWAKFIGLKGDGFSNEIDLFAHARRYDCPVVVIQGEGDLFTVPAVTRRYFEVIEAPSKDLIVVPDSGHDPNLAMLAAQLEVLRSIKRN